MARTMQTIQEDIDAIVPYSMHVSSRYLDLTKQKLELTRLPKENETLTLQEQWALGTPKSVLEPLLDHWLETYSWRAQESAFNTSLPQFRTQITLPERRDKSARNPLRTHFVHARSPAPNAVPLLYIHGWPGSFVEVNRLINLLTAPNDDQAQAFHVVCPSIPGFGFSDASEEADFGVAGAAQVFAALMRRLGYERFPLLAFGYTPAEVVDTGGDRGEERGRPLGPVIHQLLSSRPQTLAFSLCDSPVGLLAVLLDLVATQRPTSSLAGRPRSPFLDPGELEMQDREYEAAGHERVRSDNTVKASNGGAGDDISTERRSWSPTDILNWTMMMWLPGAEAGLRWLRRAHIETSSAPNTYCTVPLGISSFRTRSSSTPLMWGAASWPIRWVRRHQEVTEMPAWEAPVQLAKDMRDCFGRLLDGQVERRPESMV
ncbi:hypothetical protein N0V86_007832 [Didymella sp. IMI 355093]|nr:hypothetical protein N0V86_007832 [Didymella sp. IMI 355093]